jgi:hypothetical protein
MPDEEILKKRAKLDESFIAATNPELSSGKKSRRSSVLTPNLPNRNVATPVREKWKDDLEAKGWSLLKSFLRTEVRGDFNIHGTKYF